MKKYILIFLFFLTSFSTWAQSIPIGQTSIEEMLRVLQLTGKINQTYSFTSRPFFYNKSITRKELINLIDSSFEKKIFEKTDKKNQIKFNILPGSFSAKFNSHHPYGWNDATMIMAKGLQTSISGGVFAEAGPLSIQLQPEYIYAQNANYETTIGYGFNSSKTHSRISLGQSSIRFNFSAISIGASNENLWWGPGQFSSLLMSNNAPGFEHLTFNTTKPLKTPIGSFEWQLIVGNLNEDTTAANEAAFLNPYLRKKESRYYNGIVISYQPKWMKGFFFGITRMLQFFNKDINTRPGGLLKKYLPVLTNSSASDNFASNSSNPDDGSVSIFTRWVLPKLQSEFYFEFGYNDYLGNTRDFTLNPSHSTAYIIGFKKIINLPKNNLLDISGEITQMAQSNSYIVRNASNWYEVGANVYQGYTNQNQIMGAGSGIGNNLQTIQVKKIKGFNQIGFKFQHIQQDPQGLVGASSYSMGVRAIPWNDWSIGFLSQKRWNKFVLNAETQFVLSKNYGWETADKFNLFATVSGIYFF